MPNINATYDLQGRVIPADGTLASLAEHLGPEFMYDWQLKHPNVWRDRIPLGSFDLFNGYSQKSYVFRGTLGPQAGLSEWGRIEPSRKATSTDAGYDRCSYNPQTYTWSMDAIDFSGLSTSWRSPVFCVNDLKFQDKAQMQLGMIIKAGADITGQIKETFSRESYLLQAASNGKFVVFAEGQGIDFIDSTTARVTYSPFTVDGDGDTYITVNASVLAKISALNFTLLDQIRQYLGDQCPDAALSNEGGMPVYGLMLDLLDFEKYVLRDLDIREDFRRAIPMRLIEGFNMGFRVYRGWAMIHDQRQARYSVKSTTASTVILKRVLPRRRTRPGIIGLVPESNPAYILAEYGTMVVFLNNVIQILVPSTVSTLGSGMTFGPAPDFNGQWFWLNILDPQTNPLGENGYFFSRYEYFVKALEYAQNAMVILYRRCEQVLRTGCQIELATDAVTTAQTVAAAVVTGNFSATTNLFTVTLPKPMAAKLGDAVSVVKTVDGTTFVGYIVADHAAPTYTIGWLEGAANEPVLYTDLGAATTIAVA